MAIFWILALIPIYIIFFLVITSKGTKIPKQTIDINMYESGVKKNLANKYVEAIKDFDKFIEYNSTDVNAYLMRGYAKFEIGNDKESNQDYEKFISLNPKYTKENININKIDNIKEMNENF